MWANQVKRCKWPKVAKSSTRAARLGKLSSPVRPAPLDRLTCSRRGEEKTGKKKKKRLGTRVCVVQAQVRL